MFELSDTTVSDRLFESDLFNTGDTFFLLNNYDSAKIYFKGTIRHFESERNWLGVVSGLRKLARTHISLNEFDTAEVLLQKGVNLCKDIRNSNLELSELYFLTGIKFSNTSIPDEALVNLMNGLELRKKILGTKHNSLVKYYQEIGDVYKWILYDYDNAEKNYFEALEILEQQQDSLNCNKLFVLYYNLASTNRLKKDLHNALNYGLKALQKTECLSSNKLVYKTLCLEIVGNIYNNLGNYEKSRENYSKAIDLLKNDSSSLNYLPRLISNIGITYSNQSKETNAIKAYHTAICKYKEHSPNNINGIADTYKYIGLSFSNIAVYDSSYYYFKRAIDLYEKDSIENRMKIVQVYSYIGELNYKFDFLNASRANYESALSLAVKNSIKNDDKSIKTSNLQVINRLLIEPLQGYAKTLCSIYKQDSTQIMLLRISRQCYFLIDTIYSATRNSYTSESSKLISAEKNKNIFEEAIECCYLLYTHTNLDGFISDAHYFMEKSKARILYDNLFKSRDYEQLGINDSLIIKEKEYSSHIVFFQKELESLSEHDVVTRKKYLDKIFYYTRNLENLKKYLTKYYPNYYTLKYKNGISGLSEMQHFSMLHDRAIIQYHWGDSNLYSILITSTETQISKVSLDSINKAIIKRYISILDNLQDYSFKPAGFDEFCRISYHLYKYLLDPCINLRSRSDRIENVTIIPDGILSVIPFESFITDQIDLNVIDYRNLPYVLKKANVSYGYSSSILSQNISLKERIVDKGLIMGYQINPLKKNNESHLQNLPIKRLIKPKKLTFMLEDKALKENFLDHCSGNDLIHLALHGVYESSIRSEPRLLFYNNGDTANVNALYSKEVYNLSMNAKLTILSACETGLGQYFSGEGIYSMARAFTYSGCQTLVMSLWKVKDDPTNTIMLNFYGQLRKKLPLDVCLTNSKLAYIMNSDELLSHPSNWASFVILGDAREIKFEKTERNKFTIYVLSVIILILFSIFLIRLSRNNKVV